MKIVRYILPDNNGWKGLEIKYIDDTKGQGLFATERLTKGTAIPYYGHVVDDVQTIVDRRYIVEVLHERLYINGHPDLNPNRTPYRWYGAYINEPDHGSRANARLQVSRQVQPNRSTGAYAHVVLTKTIETGTEITICYGKQYDRTRYSR